MLSKSDLFSIKKNTARIELLLVDSTIEVLKVISENNRNPEKGVSLKTIQSKCKLLKPTTSRTLKRMVDLDLLFKKKSGAFKFFTINTHLIEKINKATRQIKQPLT